MPQRVYRARGDDWQRMPSIECHVGENIGLRLQDAQQLPIRGLNGGDTIPQTAGGQRASLRILVRCSCIAHFISVHLKHFSYL